MVAACAVAAVGAPAAGASILTATHPLDVIGTPVTYKADPLEVNNLTLTSDGTTLSFAEALPINPDPTVVAGLDTVDDCNASGATTAQCQSNASTTVDLGDGNDTLALGSNLPPLTIIGGPGTDRLDFSGETTPVSIDLGGTTPNMAVTEVENVTGGSSDDTIVGDAAGNRISGGNGIDTISGGPGVNVLRGGAGNDTLNAGDDGDSLTGGPGADTLVGGAGDDTISAADGVADTITCGAGTDTVTADLGANGVSDTFTDLDACEEVTGAVAAKPTPVANPGTLPQSVVTTTETPIIVVPALGQIMPVLAPGPANMADLTPPGAAMRTFSRQRIPTVLARGVRVRVTCNEACGISVALSVDRKTARRLQLDSRTSPVVVGTATARRIVAGNTVLRVKLTKKAKAALKAGTRNVIANTQVLVSDASGNGTLLSRHVTLVR